MTSIKKYQSLGLLLLVFLFFFSCEKDFVNPGAATEDQVLNSADGLIGLTVGIQKRWSVGRQSPVYATVAGAGFSTFEVSPSHASDDFNEGELRDHLCFANGFAAFSHCYSGCRRSYHNAR